MIFTERNDPHDRYFVELSEINRMINEGVPELVRRTEEYYNRQVCACVDGIEKLRRNIVLLAGPSGSGKTTTAQKLKKELENRKIAAHVISLDNFFVGKGNYPKLPDGRDDFESVNALDISLIHSTISDMLERGHASLPEFDFSASIRRDGASELCLNDRDIVIFEGIHALNPQLMPKEHGRDAYRVYVSPKCCVTNGGKPLIPGKILRLTRRMVRDFKFRNYLYQQTVAIWDNVCAGERKNINPFAHSADSVIDTTHFYEYGLYGNELAHLKSQEGFESEEKTVLAVKKLYDEFLPVGAENVPADAMVREFIGE